MVFDIVAPATMLLLHKVRPSKASDWPFWKLVVQEAYANQNDLLE